MGDKDDASTESDKPAVLSQEKNGAELREAAGRESEGSQCTGSKKEASSDQGYTTAGHGTSSVNQSDSTLVGPNLGKHSRQKDVDSAETLLKMSEFINDAPTTPEDTMKEGRPMRKTRRVTTDALFGSEKTDSAAQEDGMPHRDSLYRRTQDQIIHMPHMIQNPGEGDETHSHRLTADGKLSKDQHRHTLKHHRHRSATEPSVTRMSPKATDLSGDISRYLEGTEQAAKELAGVTYQLKMMQQPRQSRMIGFGEKDRRPIDPPPVVELVMRNHEGKVFMDFEEAPFLVVHASLWSEDYGTECSMVRNPYHIERASSPYVHSIVGLLVSQCYIMSNLQNDRCMVFAFPDISIRVSGRYRLKFMLFSLRDVMHSDCTAKQIIFSDPFTVYAPKAFPGVAYSTALSKSFSKQGVKIYIRPEGSRKQ